MALYLNLHIRKCEINEFESKHGADLFWYISFQLFVINKIKISICLSRIDFFLSLYVCISSRVVYEPLIFLLICSHRLTLQMFPKSRRKELENCYFWDS